ncbi:MAG: 50S ribosomal protein L21 [Candidatus Moraniibacteriota bacterium]
MIAIVSTGGKQYKVAAGDKIKVEKLPGKEGDILKLETLFLGDEKSVQVGAPLLKDISVEAKILSHGLGKKVKGIKHKPKKRYLVRFGHRQPYTQLEITKVA